MLRLTTLLFLFPLHIQALELETPAGLKKIAQVESALDTLLLPLDVWDGP